MLPSKTLSSVHLSKTSSHSAMPNSNNNNNKNISREADIRAPKVEPHDQCSSKTQLSSQGERSGTEEYSSVKAIIDGTRKMFKCPECEKIYDKRFKVRAHMRVHSTERNYTCMTCLKSFRLRCHIIRHSCMHTGEKKFTCSYCKKAFKLEWDLRTHMALHTAKGKYKCWTCDKTYCTISDFTEHWKLHSDDRDLDIGHLLDIEYCLAQYLRLLDS